MTPQRGFTLLELLIAVAIFALTGAMAYSGLQRVLDQQHDTEARAQRLTDLQKAYRIMQRDLEQLAHRPIRNEFGDTVGALVGGSGYTGLAFTRAGHANPAGFVRSELQRVSYLPDQDSLLRRTWRVLDRAQDSQPDEQVLVEHLQRLELRFLDESGNWQDTWPVQQASTTASPAANDTFPKAIEVELELDDVGTLRWLFMMPEPVSLNPATGGGTGGNGAQGGG